MSDFTGPELASLIRETCAEAKKPMARVIEAMGRSRNFLQDLERQTGPATKDTVLLAKVALELVCGVKSERFDRRPPTPPPPPPQRPRITRIEPAPLRPLNPSKVFCEQCDRAVFIQEGRDCAAPFCKAKGENADVQSV